MKIEHDCGVAGRSGRHAPEPASQQLDDVRSLGMDGEANTMKVPAPTARHEIARFSAAVAPALAAPRASMRKISRK